MPSSLNYTILNFIVHVNCSFHLSSHLPYAEFSPSYLTDTSYTKWIFLIGCQSIPYGKGNFCIAQNKMEWLQICTIKCHRGFCASATVDVSSLKDNLMSTYLEKMFLCGVASLLASL